MEYKNIGILLMAGKSSRIDGITKQFYQSKAESKPMYVYPLTTLNEALDDVILVVPQGYGNRVKNQALAYLGKIFDVVEGGETRTESVSRGLKLVEEKYGREGVNVLIHDAARPYVPLNVVKNVKQLLDTHDAVTPVMDVYDSLLSVEEGNSHYLDRNSIKRVQTPQGFRLSLILDAYAKLDGDSKTDDYQLVASTCKNPCICKGSALSFKVTTNDDIAIYDIIANQK